MFGYVQVNKDELSEQSMEDYQSFYCGLCQELKGSFGAKGQMLLNYDMTFLIILLTGLYELETSKEQFICPLHPTKKKTAYKNEASQYASDMNIILTYHNLVDDWNDDGSHVKHAVSKIIKKDYLRVADKYPRQVKAIEDCLRRLDEMEKSRETNIDAVAGCTGEMLAEVFAWKDDIWSNDLKTMGFFLGKYVYLMDAYDDLKKDSKKNSYNPFVDMATNSPDQYEEWARFILTSMISESAKAFERLPILKHIEILKNIMYSGVWSKYEYLQQKKQRREA